MRPSHTFLLFLSCCLAALAAFVVDARSRIERFHELRGDLGRLTSTLELTDFSLITDARYARHPSQADLFSAFQDYPGSIEHFPSGSVIPAPRFTDLGTSLLLNRK